MWVSYLAGLTLLAAPAVRATTLETAQTPPAALAAGDPDSLYREREQAASATAAEQIWAARVAASPRDFESAWKLARARYWLGTNGPGTNDDKKRMLERGIEAARVAAAARPAAPDGHFWLAANMGALADAHGLRQGIKYRGPIKAALEAALAADPSYLAGSPDRALGRWYFKVPRLFGGDLTKSEDHLRASLQYKPDSVITLIFLADTLIARNHRAEARAALQAAIDAPADPDWIPEDTRFKAQARRQLSQLK